MIILSDVYFSGTENFVILPITNSLLGIVYVYNLFLNYSRIDIWN